MPPCGARRQPRRSLEVNLYDLLTELEQVPQTVHAGELVGGLPPKIEGYVEPTRFNDG